MNASPEPVAAFAIGIQSRVPWDEYTALPAISISRLKELRRSPLHYLHRLEHPKESRALSLGTAAHTAVLEPERFAQQFAVWSRRSDSGNLCPRRGQYWDAFVAENPGKTIITEDEEALAVAISVAVRGHSVAARYLESGDPEVTLQWMLDDRACRGRVDWLTRENDRPVLVGLKTSADCRHFIFGTQAAKLGYHLQWAFYYDGYRSIRMNEDPRVVEIVVESEPPHAVAVYSIPDEIIEQGRDEYTNLMRQLRDCEATGHFPGPQEFEEPLSLPSWVYQQQDDLSDLGLSL